MKTATYGRGAASATNNQLIYYYDLHSVMGSETYVWRRFPGLHRSEQKMFEKSNEIMAICFWGKSGAHFIGCKGVRSPPIGCGAHICPETSVRR